MHQIIAQFVRSSHSPPGPPNYRSILDLRIDHQKLSLSLPITPLTTSEVLTIQVISRTKIGYAPEPLHRQIAVIYTVMSDQAQKKIYR